MDKRSHQLGFATALIIVFSALISIGALYFFDHLKRSRNTTVYSLARLKAQLLIDSLFRKTIRIIESPSLFPGCPAGVGDFRRVDQSSDKELIINQLIFLNSCFNLDATERDLIDKFEIRLIKKSLSTDRKDGTSQLEFHAALSLKPYLESISVHERQSKVLQVSIATPERFVLLVGESSTQPKIQTDKAVQITVHSPVWLRRKSSLVLPVIALFQPINALKANASVWWDGVLSFSQQSDISPVYQALASNFTKGFRQLSQAFQEAVLPQERESAKWTQPLDYFYVYNDFMSYPLPTDVPSALTEDEYFVEPSRGQVRNFPDGQILQSLEQTCSADRMGRRGDNPFMYIYAGGYQVRLQFSSNSQFFCGAIYADELILELQGNREYAFLGQIFVKKLSITGQGKVHLINPLNYSSYPSWLDSVPQLNLSRVASMMVHHRVALGRNWFLPIQKNGVSLHANYQPRWLKDYLVSCGIRKCWPTQVSPWDFENLYSDSDWHNKVLFSVEDIL